MMDAIQDLKDMNWVGGYAARLRKDPKAVAKALREYAASLPD